MPMAVVVREAAAVARRHRSEGRRARRPRQLSPRKRRKSRRMRVRKRKKKKANDLPTYKTLLFILNNLLGLNLLQSKMGLTFQSLYDISPIFKINVLFLIQLNNIFLSPYEIVDCFAVLFSYYF